MALIKCPECGKDVTDTASKCIHCGYMLKSKKSKKVTLIVLVGGILISVISTLFVMTHINFGDKLQYEELFELLECKQSDEVKDILGNNYEHNIFDIGGGVSAIDSYKEAKVAGLDCRRLYLDYDENNNDTLFTFDIVNIDSECKDAIIDEFIAYYGGNYIYSVDSNNGLGENYTYLWKNRGSNGSVSINIFADSDSENMYYIKVMDSFK